jgi:hypothetical protein
LVIGLENSAATTAIQALPGACSAGIFPVKSRWSWFHKDRAMKGSSMFILLIVLGSAFGVSKGGWSVNGNSLTFNVIFQNK